MFKQIEDLLKYVNNEDIKFIDFRYTEFNEKWKHITYIVNNINEDFFEKGILFKSNNLDTNELILLPDITTAFLDPFSAQQTLVLICDIIDAETNKPFIFDSRHISKKADQYLLETKIANKITFNSRINFFVFDDYKSDLGKTCLCFNNENNKLSDDEKHTSKTKHKNKIEDYYMCLSPVDQLHDLRSEILNMMLEVLLVPLYHYHEANELQCSIALKSESLVSSGDAIQKSKYVINNTANSYGKIVEFNSKAFNQEIYSLLSNISLWSSHSNIFLNNNGVLTDLCLYYIGGLFKHANTIRIFSNFSSNEISIQNNPVSFLSSYFSKNNKLANFNRNNFGLEIRDLDIEANHYLSLAVQLMAGLDGIKNKIDPEKEFFNLTKEEAKSNFKNKSKFSKELLEALNKDRDFLLQNNVFTNEQIDSYIKIIKLK